ncbi:hypothetical protein DICVIV_04327 [Dictyocaulus viviparus]|uniref:Uncharacterized protein n=1 Tax=Dictyocaulus viviparus TaxID=29172 RepID=A0A0D8Y0H5_DICVI|nr:hypothetical protein DICVIV_04327 [Dictyocaulus viviparus]
MNSNSSMVRIVTEGSYVPWYARRSFPVFCMPCIPTYMGIWPASAGALIPLALILLIVGILLFHCGWAAHLLDESGQVPIKEKNPITVCFFHSRKTVTTTTTTTYEDPESDLAEKRLLESAYIDPVPEVKQGYWQFDEKESWQAVANPYPIQNFAHFQAYFKTLPGATAVLKLSVSNARWF